MITGKNDETGVGAVGNVAKMGNPPLMSELVGGNAGPTAVAKLDPAGMENWSAPHPSANRTQRTINILKYRAISPGLRKLYQSNRNEPTSARFARLASLYRIWLFDRMAQQGI